MDYALKIQVDTEKIYKQTPIRVATFLGGPLVAGYLIAQNFKAFDDEASAKKTWIYAILASILIFGAALFMPNAERFRYIIPLLYSYIAGYLVQIFQRDKINAHITAGGAVYSWWRVILIRLIGCVITLALLVIVILLFVGDK